MSVRQNKRLSRLYELYDFDKKILASFNKTSKLKLKGVVGVDEVGRGSLIGPVVSAAVAFYDILDNEILQTLLDLDDSKSSHLNHTKRLYLSLNLKKICMWGLGEASKDEVETLNVYKASLLASHRAVMNLKSQFSKCLLEDHLVIVDGKTKIPNLAYAQIAEIKADAKSAAVASASVIAKAYRDELLIHFSKDYPGYEWDKNAGYPTISHKRAIQALGITPLHRRTYKIKPIAQ